MLKVSAQNKGIQGGENRFFFGQERGESMSETQSTYNYKVVRQFAVMTVVWGIVGMLVGVIIAAQLVWPELNVGWLHFGRLRPLHTNAVIFAFGGSALFATSYYVVQRTCHTRIFSDGLAAFTFWGWQLVIVLAAVTLPLGFTQGKEYAELEWPIDILITLVWVAYAVVFFGTIAKRKVTHIYVANWFYGGFILAVALLHMVNSAAIPVSLTKSYSAYAGVQDAMVQWWYGHNAVGFFLTAGFLGMMYYFVPKQAERPVYSYRLSVVHFWALIFTYMWAGPHHLHYTALPDWTQSVGMLFSLILLAPSWGGMINGVMTLSGAWHKLRDDPILKFLITSLSFYGMSTFEGPMMAIKTVNALSHYTDWTVGPRAFGCAGLGGDDFDRFDLLPVAAPVRQARDVQRQADHGALLGGDDRRRALHRLDVDCRRDAGPDVAGGQPRWHADLQLRRIGQGFVPVLGDPFPRWRSFPLRHADHGLQHGQDDCRWPDRRMTHASCCLPLITPDRGIK
jgi:cytochrome c oxidase cbb3-type subunit 1